MCPESSSSDRSSLEKPFETEPRPLAEPASGCSRMALIGCAAAAILVGITLIAMMLKARDLVVWSLSNVRSQIEERVPEDLPEAQRARLSSAFDAALDRLRSHDLEPAEFRHLQAALLEFARLSEEPERDDVRRLTEELERFADPAGEAGTEGETRRPAAEG